jgi:hypothetical protein
MFMATSSLVTGRQILKSSRCFCRRAHGTGGGSEKTGITAIPASRTSDDIGIAVESAMDGPAGGNDGFDGNRREVPE